jgi:hypothetical protein
VFVETIESLHEIEVYESLTPPQEKLFLDVKGRVVSMLNRIKVAEKKFEQRQAFVESLDTDTPVVFAINKLF